ncbi:iron-hydroxamate ABC transporter substrate-binding protein [Saliterribacillus persicus]|uniref:Iron complex transport system substrate-binding protein n=1 Tax=Saliterribacillus persicus TaxID=930114 RepID=A0A368YBA2_9BACI|nr:iron-hydroxamate ABC transporter substrate-binding protein [Saliterribacillus persicus]RCW76979.1 iron complex transport system substrate-binding protein [Saliterribacillus persicus]
MKQLKTLFIMVIFLLLISACGQDDQTSQAKGESETKIYTDTTGVEVEIPKNPERIVTTQYLDAMIALGHKPVGAATHVLDNNYLKEKQEGVVDIGNPVNVEKVLELEPDLIITANPEEVEQLSKIAPTVVIAFNAVDVYGQLTEVGKVLGKEDEAEAWIADYKEKSEEAQEQLNGVIGEDETVSIFMTYKNILRVYGGRNIGHIFYRSLGLTPPPYIQEKIADDPEFVEFNNEEISMEKLPELAGDHIIMLNYGPETSEEGGMFNDIENSTLWQNLDAVEAGNFHVIQQEPWFTYSPIASKESLELSVDLLTK